MKKLKLMSLQRRRERYCIIHVWKILNGHAPNEINFEFSTNERLGVKASLPPLNNMAQLSVKTDYDNSFRVRAAQLWNTLPPVIVASLQTLDGFKAGLGRFLEQYPDTGQSTCSGIYYNDMQLVCTALIPEPFASLMFYTVSNTTSEQ